MAEGRAAAAISRLGRISRELADRRALRERHAAAVKEQARDSLQKQGAVAERAAKHLGELTRRQRDAGGWATDKSLADKDTVMGFGPEEADQQTDEFARYADYAASPAPAPQQHVRPEVQHSEPKPERKYSRSVAPPPDPEPVQPPPPPPPRRSRHRVEDSFDDDDFSNNSWLK